MTMLELKQAIDCTDYEMADCLGITPDQLAKKLNGKIEWTAYEIARIVSYIEYIPNLTF